MRVGVWKVSAIKDSWDGFLGHDTNKVESIILLNVVLPTFLTGQVGLDPLILLYFSSERISFMLHCTFICLLYGCFCSPPTYTFHKGTTSLSSQPLDLSLACLGPRNMCWVHKGWIVEAAQMGGPQSPYNSRGREFWELHTQDQGIEDSDSTKRWKVWVDKKLKSCGSLFPTMMDKMLFVPRLFSRSLLDEWYRHTKMQEWICDMNKRNATST